jgi:hypothetical protein
VFAGHALTSPEHGATIKQLGAHWDVLSPCMLRIIEDLAGDWRRADIDPDYGDFAIEFPPRRPGSARQHRVAAEVVARPSRSAAR